MVPVFAGDAWVWLGGTLQLPSSEQFQQARTLLGPEKTPCGVVLGAALGLAGLTHDYFVWWRCGGWGVVVC